MSSQPPPVPRKPPGVRVMMTPGKQPPYGGLSMYTDSGRVNGTRRDSNPASPVDAEREVEILNHCFDDVERLMARLQQAADAQCTLNQKKTKSSKKSKKKGSQDDDVLVMKARPPSEQEFVHIFKKIKYSLCLLDRLKSSITQPDAAELLQPIFVPLRLMVKTTGGPALGASVVSPAMTSGAVSLLREHLTEEDKELWISLGSNWTLPCSHLGVSVPPYSPLFLDGWQPPACDPSGQPLEDPIQAQHRQDAFRESRETQTSHDRARQTAEGYGEGTDDTEGHSLPPEGERIYCCSYDFVARNSSELSVLQGETLEVFESSKRWWKCQNRFGEIGFVPFNILEPLSALHHAGRDSPVAHGESQKKAFSPRTKCFSYAPQSPVATSPAMSPLRPQSMFLPSSPPAQGEDSDRVLIMNDELLARLSKKRGSGRPAAPRTATASAPVSYQSPPAEVSTWLTTKGFSQETVQSLGVLNGGQLFSLSKEELRLVSPEEGSRVYSQIMVQRAQLEDVHKDSELETAMQRQKLKAGM